MLLDEAHWGKVFVHSIFVADAPTYVRFGLNYIGEHRFQAHVDGVVCVCAHAVAAA